MRIEICEFRYANWVKVSGFTLCQVFPEGADGIYLILMYLCLVKPLSMALSKEDLQAIEEIVDRKLDEKLDQKLDLKLAPITTDLKELRGDVSEMKKDLKILARIAQLDLIKQEKRLSYLTAD